MDVYVWTSMYGWVCMVEYVGMSRVYIVVFKNVNSTTTPLTTNEDPSEAPQELNCACSRRPGSPKQRSGRPTASVGIYINITWLTRGAHRSHTPRGTSSAATIDVTSLPRRCASNRPVLLHIATVFVYGHIQGVGVTAYHNVKLKRWGQMLRMIGNSWKKQPKQ